MEENCITEIDTNLQITMKYESKSFSIDSGQLRSIDTNYIKFTINDNGTINKQIVKKIHKGF